MSLATSASPPPTHTHLGMYIGQPVWSRAVERNAGVHAVSWSPDNKYVIVGTSHKDIRGYDAKTGDDAFTITCAEFTGECITSIVVSPDSSFFIAFVLYRRLFCRASLTDPAQEKVIVNTDDVIRRVDISRDNKNVFVSILEGVNVYSSSTMELINHVHLTGSWRILACMSDSRFALTVEDRGIQITRGSRVRIENWTTGENVLQLQGQVHGYVSCSAVSQCGQWALTCSSDGIVQVWSPRADSPGPEVFAKIGGTLTSVAISPNSRFCAMADMRRVLVWSLATRELERVLDIYDRQHDVDLRFCNVAFSPDSTRIVAGSNFRGHTSVWDLYHNARKVILAALSHESWSRFFLDRDGDHAIVSRVVGFM